MAACGQSGERHDLCVGQRQRPAGHPGERSAAASRLAGDHVGHAALREQPAGPCSGLDSRRTAARVQRRGAARRRRARYPRKDGLVSMGRIIAVVIILVTIGLVVIGTLWPVPTAAAYAGETPGSSQNWSTPQASVQTLAHDIGTHAWAKAYASLDNKGQFSEQDFIRDLNGAQFSLRTFADLDGFHVRPLHATDDRADTQLQLHWSTVVGNFTDTRNVHVVRVGDQWKPVWPLVQEPKVPPQVIPVNYLRWDVIY